MSCTAISNGLSVDTILFGGEEKAENFCPVAVIRSCGVRGIIEGLMFDEELDILEEGEIVGGVGAAPEVFSWPE